MNYLLFFTLTCLIGGARVVNAKSSEALRESNIEVLINLEVHVDSVPLELIGWWQADTSLYMRLPNTNLRSSNFTINIRKDGRAVIYKYNLFDDQVSYSYIWTEEGLDLRRGCVIDKPIKIEFTATGKLLMTSQWPPSYEVQFSRLKEIK